MKSWPRWGRSTNFPLALASQFLREQNAAQDTRICGLNAFNPEQGSLFLPRLLWRRTAGHATLRLQLWSDRSLVEDARVAQDFLQRLRPARSMRPLSVHVEHETHQPQQAEWLKLIRRATETIARGDFERLCSPGQPICSSHSALTLSR